MPRGGKRNGAGRPKLSNNIVIISVAVEEEQLNQLDDITDNRSKTIRDALYYYFNNKSNCASNLPVCQ